MWGMVNSSAKKYHLSKKMLMSGIILLERQLSHKQSRPWRGLTRFAQTNC
jgi:hypothetical protein